jgi:two-component system KDP operon response regulator KdpE
MDGTAQIVIVEDDAQIRRFVRTSLETDSYRVSEAETQSRGAIEAGTRKPDLLIIDLGLPDGSGIDLIRDIRGWSNVPVLVLSARVDERDKIEALDAGADDYLTKPFGTGELLARVRAMLRRSARTPESSASARAFGDVTVDLAARTVARGEERLHITPVEFRLLAHLISHPGQVLTHRQLLREIWGPSHSNDSHYLRIYMARLRQKLERDPARPRHFITETGVGYRFVPD